MAQRRRTTPRRRTAAAGSWLALLAATTLGDGADTLQADIQAHGVRDGAYRLVVQSYDADLGGVPGFDARPVGSVQRAVTAAELRDGVRVNLLELRPHEDTVATGRPMVVAWIEAGDPDLEFDGRRARPQPGSVYGLVRRDAKQDAVRISLNRLLAA
ncbi:MAG: hypothetical protein ACRELB_16275 [Polyangiaceae bacterium]